MPFETPSAGRKKIAVIGAGISGMGAAWLLSDRHDVTLYEAETRLGGHARTRMAGPNSTAVDTGFIVFNYANYPKLAEMFGALDVPVAKSRMSFGASIDGGRIEYSLSGLDTLFAQRWRALDPRYIRMIRDILRFNRDGLALAQRHPDLSIGEFLDMMGTGPWFRDHYLLPFSGAIWSTPVEAIMDFPAHAMMSFFDNHALLNYEGQHQWYTVKGGSIEYVSRLEIDMLARGVDIRLKAPVQSVTRRAGGAQVKVWGADAAEYDEVVFATHSDDTLAMLSDASPQEQTLLGAVGYQPNDVVLHSDPGIMQKRRKTWSSWNYVEAKGGASERIDLTYWMNSLQPLPPGEDFFVTLNTKRPIREDLIWDQVTLRHPVYDLAALKAQKQAAEMNGQQSTWFCGAWMKNGFHEDGLSSAHDVANRMAKMDAAQVAAE